jgi:hypothetical protein|tara:strand:- start:2742 stop:3086 length:345 start_codon:yes stop_codon:yes gene_type:complete
MDSDPHFPTCRVNVNGSVVVASDDCSVGGGRLRQLLNLFAQDRYPFARCFQSGIQLLVMGSGVGQVSLDFTKLGLKMLDPDGRIFDPPAQFNDLGLKSCLTISLGPNVRFAFGT